MKIGIIGQGYVGLTISAFAAEYFEVVGFDKFNDFVRRVVARAARLGVVVQHRINDGASRSWFLVNHIGDGPGGGVKNAVDLGLVAGCAHRELLFELSLR